MLPVFRQDVQSSRPSGLYQLLTVLTKWPPESSSSLVTLITIIESLLPTESDERGVLGCGSMPVTILPSRHFGHNNAM